MSRKPPISRERMKGKGIGQFLLMDALRRSLEAAANIAAMAVLVDATDDAAEAFYRHFSFLPLHERPRRLFLSMKTVARLLVIDPYFLAPVQKTITPQSDQPLNCAGAVIALEYTSTARTKSVGTINSISSLDTIGAPSTQMLGVQRPRLSEPRIVTRSPLPLGMT